MTVLSVVGKGKERACMNSANPGQTIRAAYESGDGDEIEDEEEDCYTEDEDHVHGDSDDDIVREISSHREEVTSDDWLRRNQSSDGHTPNRSHARLSSHLRNMVGNAKSLAAASSSTGSDHFQELLTKGAC